MVSGELAKPRARSLPVEPGSWADFPAFIEVQFPVSKVSKESYKERKAVAGQTLTALGKWWGRKPLVLVRAALLGLLLPSTDDPHTDRQIFLSLMTMDDEGLESRISGTIPAQTVAEHCTANERQAYFDLDRGKAKWKASASQGERRRMQKLSFLRMGYDERLRYCRRPEEISGPSNQALARANAYLATNASSLPDLIQQLGIRRFGHPVRVGDAFSGGGSIPYEAARLGCTAFASDLNPVAGLLSWGAFKIVGGGQAASRNVRQTLGNLYQATKQQIDAWEIEKNSEGWVADAYLYCNEVIDPHTGWKVPLAGSWIIAPKQKVIARLVPKPDIKAFDIDIIESVTPDELGQAEREGTWSNGLICPVDRGGQWLIPSLRTKTGFDELKGREGLRRWTADDIVPRPDDAFQERLYCIRWINTSSGERHYRAPREEDLVREQRVLELLSERYDDWSRRRIIPTNVIQPGRAINRPTNARGWTYWKHFYNPRQLLLNGLVAEIASSKAGLEGVAALLAVGRVADANSRLARWKAGQGGGIGGTISTFYSPSLNTPFPNYGCRTATTLESTICLQPPDSPVLGDVSIDLCDARAVFQEADLWITDPGYSDAVEYAELSEFFLAWLGKRLESLFPGWYADSKRALAVEASGLDFRKAMMECYSRLAGLMPDRGLQLVMFTHQDAEVWADLALILWSAGLQVTAAWTVATETESAGIKQGNHVQGTVMLVVRKRQGHRLGDLSDLYPDLQSEVLSQVQVMRELEDKEDPNFNDADYQLAAYAAALRVLTAYSSIDEIDISRELTRPRARSEESPLVSLIARAVKIASDALVPSGLDRNLWRNLSAHERFYLKGMEVEAHGDYREGVYQEYARGYGVRDYRPLLGSGAANHVRLKAPSEFRARDLEGDGFSGSLLRKILFAIYKSSEEQDPRVGRVYLKTELPDYWDRRQQILELLTFLAEKPKLESSMPHWEKDVEAARLLRGSVENDSV